MAKSPKPRSKPAPRAAAAPARGMSSLMLRTVGVRVGIAVAVVAIGAGVYMWREKRADVATQEAAPPARVAVAQPKLVTPQPAPKAEPTETPEPPHREANAEPKPMNAATRTAFDTWLMAAYAKCWHAPKTLPDGDPYLPKVRVTFNADGELASAPKLVNPPSDPAWKAHADAAIKAVKGCDPLHVPDKYADYYPAWKSRTVYFDPTRN